MYRNKESAARLCQRSASPMRLFVLCYVAMLTRCFKLSSSPSLVYESTPRSLNPTASHLDQISRRTRRRKRGAAAAERSSHLDVETTPFQHMVRHQSRRELPPPPFRYVCVLDVEATCEEFNKDFIHEIIEFPVVLVDLLADDGPTVVDEFHSYVRPTVNGTLSEFCKRLTGISQSQVDRAPTLPEVLSEFDSWRLRKGLQYSEEQKDFAFAADGPFDLRFFLHAECVRKELKKPIYYDKWINVKSMFADFYHTRHLKIHKMLARQNMEFEGRLHSGIDDTRNVCHRHPSCLRPLAEYEDKCSLVSTAPASNPVQPLLRRLHAFSSKCAWMAVKYT